MHAWCLRHFETKYRPLLLLSSLVGELRIGGLSI